jgi:hypothetical protein
VYDHLPTYDTKLKNKNKFKTLGKHFIGIPLHYGYEA